MGIFAGWRTKMDSSLPAEAGGPCWPATLVIDATAKPGVLRRADGRVLAGRQVHRERAEQGCASRPPRRRTSTGEPLAAAEAFTSFRALERVGLGRSEADS